MSEHNNNARPVVAVIGGGYGGITTAKALDEFADVILVEPRDAFVHNVAALRALVEPDWLPSIFLPYDHLLANGRVVRARATAIDGRRVVLSSGVELTPDFVVLATGSTYPYPAKTGTDGSAEAIDRYRRTHEELARADRVLIVGAGPTGLELAGEVEHRWPEKQITILEPESDILGGPYKQALRDEIRRQLEDRGVELVLGEGLTGEPEGPAATFGQFAVTTTTGRTIETDIWFRCYGLRPLSDCLDGALLAATRADGSIEVTETLQLAGYPHVFALGDVAAADLKGAGRAGRQGEVVAANIRALVEGRDPQPYEPSPPAIVIPLGPTGGASELPGQTRIAGAAATAELKGSHLFVERYRALFGLEEHPAAP